MNFFLFLIIANLTPNNNMYIPYIKSKVNKPKYLCHRINLIKFWKHILKNIVAMKINIIYYI